MRVEINRKLYVAEGKKSALARHFTAGGLVNFDKSRSHGTCVILYYTLNIRLTVALDLTDSTEMLRKIASSLGSTVQKTAFKHHQLTESEYYKIMLQLNSIDLLLSASNCLL